MLEKSTLKKALAAVGFSVFAVSALAQECSVTIDSTDAMKYDRDAIEVSKSCTEFTVTLTHSGKLAKNVMGHNWVLSEAAAMQAIVRDGAAAGLDNGYLKPGDERVLAATDMIGGGEQTGATFQVSVLEEGKDYQFFCSFPGHMALMKGSVTLVP